MTAALAKDGDKIEQDHWPLLKAHFPAYEEFWRFHAYPLRGEDGQIRADIDGRLELMAQENYKCFVSVANAMTQLSDDSHPENVFSSLQNAANRAQGVVAYFEEIRTECLGLRQKIDCQPFRDYAGGLSLYRNYIHESMMGALLRHGKRLMPTAERLKDKRYERWSRLRAAPDADLVPILQEMNTSFAALMKLLHHYWDEMLKASPDIVQSARYKQLLPPLKNPSQASEVRISPMTIVASSNTQIG